LLKWFLLELRLLLICLLSQAHKRSASRCRTSPHRTFCL
jgi:hypothetical protein